MRRRVGLNRCSDPRQCSRERTIRSGVERMFQKQINRLTTKKRSPHKPAGSLKKANARLLVAAVYAILRSIVCCS